MAPDRTAPILDAGARFRLTRTGRPGVFEFGLGRDGYGTVKVFPKGDVLMTVDGREYAVRPADGAPGLVLLADGREVARFTHGRKDTGEVAIGGHALAVTFPRRRRKTGAIAESDGTPLAEMRVQGGVIVVEVFRSLAPLAAAFATVALALRLAYKRPAPEITPVWEPSKATWWGGALAGAWVGGAAASDFGGHDSGGGAGDFGGGGGGGDGGGGF